MPAYLKQVRLLVVSSFWVQFLTAITTPCYVASIVEGREVIEDKMEIHRTPWFYFSDLCGELRILLHVFEATSLVPWNVIRSQPPKVVESRTERKSSKRYRKDERRAEAKRQMSCDRSYSTIDDACLEDLENVLQGFPEASSPIVGAGTA